MEQAGWLNGQVIPLTNIQSPLRKGVVDRAFSGVGLRMLQFLARRNPYAYAVGMGSEENPFARLLKGAGWTVARVPFQFAVIRARFLREIGPVRAERNSRPIGSLERRGRRGWRRMAANAQLCATVRRSV
jgi:hypothetical protein